MNDNQPSTAEDTAEYQMPPALLEVLELAFDRLSELGLLENAVKELQRRQNDTDQRVTDLEQDKAAYT